MNDFEARISVLLHDVVPQPRRQLDPDDVFATTPRRRRKRVLAPLGAITAIVAIVAIAVAITVLGSGRGGHPAAQVTRPQTTHSSQPTDPAALYGVVWTLSRIHGLKGTTDAAPDAAITFRFTRTSTAPGAINITQGRCALATANVHSGRITFRQDFATVTPTGCGPNLGIAQNNFVFRLLSGTVSWNVSGDQLTITHPGMGSLDFTGQPAPAQATVSGQLQAVSGPAGTPARALPGTVRITDNNTHVHRTIKVGADGRFSATLPTGVYTIEGHSPQYNGGRTACHASAPVSLNLTGPITANVYCQER